VGWLGCGRKFGRRTLDKTVSSKSLAIAVDAVAMGIQWHFGTVVRVGADIERDRLEVWKSGLRMTWGAGEWPRSCDRVRRVQTHVWGAGCCGTNCGHSSI